MAKQKPAKPDTSFNFGALARRPTGKKPAGKAAKGRKRKPAGGGS